jgi:hypothetical protein
MAQQQNSVQLNNHELFSSVSLLQILGYREGDTAYIRLLPPKNFPTEEAQKRGLTYISKKDGKVKKSVISASITLTKEGLRVFDQWDEERSLDWLVGQNHKGFGVYYVVNPGTGYEIANVSHSRVLFYEIDDLPLAEQWQKLQAFEQIVGKKASLVVKTRKSLHVYFVLSEGLTDLDLWSRYQQRFVQQFSSDAGLCNPNRLMRVPGFNHVHWSGTEFEFVPVTMEQDEETVFTLDELDAVLPAWDANRWGLKTYHHPDANSDVTDYRDNPYDIRNFAHYLDGYAENGRGYFTCRCPVHNGESDNSLHINEETGGLHCWNGCNTRDVYHAALDIAVAHGYSDPRKKKEVKTMSNREELKQKIIDILNDETLDEADKQLELEALRKQEGIQDFTWRKKIVEPIEKTVKQLSNSLSAPEKTKVYRLSELLDMAHLNLKWVAPGLLPANTSIMLTGLPGDGKTLLAVDLAVAAVKGGEFLNASIKPQRVMMLIPDQPISVTINYLLERGLDPTHDGENLMLNGQGAPGGCWDIRQMDLLKQWLEEFKPDLVIIDSIRSAICYPLQIAEKEAEIGEHMKQVENLVIPYGSLVWLHHDNKNKEQVGVSRSSGSTAIPANVSVIWRIERLSKDPTCLDRSFTMPKTRGFEAQSLCIRFNSENGHFDVIRSEGESEEALAQASTLKEKLITFLTLHSGVRYEIEELATRFGNRDSIKKTLTRLVQQGVVSRAKSQRKEAAYQTNVYWIDSADNAGQENVDERHYHSTVNKNPITLTTYRVNGEGQVRDNEGQVRDMRDNSVNLSPIPINLSPILSPTETQSELDFQKFVSHDVGLSPIHDDLSPIQSTIVETDTGNGIKKLSSSQPHEDADDSVDKTQDTGASKNLAPDIDSMSGTPSKFARAKRPFKQARYRTKIEDLTQEVPEDWN